MTIQVPVYSRNGEEIRKIDLSDEVWTTEYRPHLISELVILQLENKRVGTKSVKTRSTIRGGGRKPFRQKGTGRARQGSIRAPHWRGGAVAHGPKPQVFLNSIPKKKKNLAYRSLLAYKLNNEEIKVVEDIKFEKPKTKEMYEILNNLSLTGKKIAIIYTKDNEFLNQASRNLPKVKPVRVESINLIDLANADVVLFTEGAIKHVDEVFKKGVF